MAEEELKPDPLDERAILAKTSEIEIERLLEDYKPFLISRVAKYSLKSNPDQYEELISTAAVAFYESIRNYDPEKGHFFPYAERVVSGRIIDYLRTAGKYEGKTVSLEPWLDEDGKESSSQPHILDELSMRSYDEQKRQELISDEIKQFKSELEAWGITLEALSKHSPKHKRLRDTYKGIVKVIADNEGILDTMRLKHYYPVKEISKATELPMKNVERARLYVIAALIIKTGEYDFLSEYIFN